MTVLQIGEIPRCLFFVWLCLVRRWYIIVGANRFPPGMQWPTQGVQDELPRFFQQLENSAHGSSRVYLPQWNAICRCVCWAHLRSLRPKPRWGKLTVLPSPPSWWGRWLAAPFPRNFPRSWPLGLEFRPCGPRSAPQDNFLATPLAVYVGVCDECIVFLRHNARLIT